MAVRRKHLLIFFSGCAVIALTIYLTSGLWLRAVGHALVSDDGAAPADAAIVLAGDFGGVRLLGAADLLRKSLVPIVLVSGPPGMYGMNEADAAIEFLVRHGIDPARFIPVRHSGMSTRAEAEALLAELARRGIRKVDVVTSNYHTRRARRIYLATEKDVGGGPEIHMVSIRDPNFDPDAWWRNRESQKIVFFEWTKLVTSTFGI